MKYNSTFDSFSLSATKYNSSLVSQSCHRVFNPNLTIILVGPSPVHTGLFSFEVNVEKEHLY